MKNRMHEHKKWKWIIGWIVCFTVLFSGFLLVKQRMELRAATATSDYTVLDSDGGTVIKNGGNAASGTFSMHRRKDTLQIFTPNNDADAVVWSSQTGAVVSIEGTARNGHIVTLKANNEGHENITVTIGSIQMMIGVDVVFSINEFFGGTSDKYAFAKINTSDARRSLVITYKTGMDYLPFGQTVTETTTGGAVTLNLMFGNATDVSPETGYQWKSDNDDVVKIATDNTGKAIGIEAVGAGTTKLTVTKNSDSSVTDTINVYVRPEIKVNDTTISGDEISGGTSSTRINVDSGEYIYANMLFNAHKELSSSDKLVWAIAKYSATSSTAGGSSSAGGSEDDGMVFVRDSLGNKGTGADDADLIYDSSKNAYLFNAKSGQYAIFFFVKGTYSTYEKYKREDYGKGCPPISFFATVNCNYKDNTVNLNIGGSLDLSKAFNIPLDVLKGGTSESPDFTVKYIDTYNGQTYSVTCLDTPTEDKIIPAKSEGTACVEVEYHNPKDIPGMDPTKKIIHIIVNVSNTFSLNISEANMKVGAKLNLSGIVGSGGNNTSSQFEWKTSEGSNTYISIETNGQYATVTAKKVTGATNPVDVTLYWTNVDGVVRSATCRIYIDDAIKSFKIIPDTVKMNSGEIKDLTTDLQGYQELIWTTTDPNIVTVTPNNGNYSAKITAGRSSGTAYIQAVNPSNGVYARCEVTVNLPITDLKIGIKVNNKVTAYENYSPAISDHYVFMEPIYKPLNTTDKTFIWTSSDPKIATVDSNGTATILAEGQTTITLKNMLSGLYAQCILKVVAVPIDNISSDASSLKMIKGENHTVIAKIKPENATDKTLTWKVADTKIVTVTPDKTDPTKAVIAAKGVGTTSVTVAGGKAEPYTITVNVRNKLNSIAFGSSEKYIMLGESQQVDVSFNPADDINKKLIWSSTDESKVTITQDGVITGKGVGDAMIACKAEDLADSAGITMMVHVTEKEIPAKDFALIPVEGTTYVGDTFKVDTAFKPKNATNQEVTWSSSDEKIAKVDKNGLVTPVAPGEVTIQAIYTATDSGIPWTRFCKLTVKPARVKATSLTLSPASKNTMVGKTFTIKPVFTPENATYKTVTYQSTDENVATVNSKGVVTAKAPGEVMIQAQCYDGYFATCVVHVDGAVNFKLSPSKRDLAVGKTFQISKKVSFKTSKKTPSKTATWKSSNTNIATVSTTGKVHAYKKGTCTITCTLTKYQQSATCKVTVGKQYSKVSFSKSLYRIGAGQKYTLKPVLKYNDSKAPKVRFKSSNSSVASIGSSSGKITAKQPGYTTITVTTRDKFHATAKCRVWVVRRVSSFKLSPDYAICYVGRTKTLHAVIKPSNATVKKLKWKSSNTKIATVNGGRIRGIKKGTVYITAYTTDGSNKKASCYVKVKDPIPSTGVIIGQKDITMKKGDSTKISYTKIPSDSTDSVKFASDNHRVATVDKHGKVKAVGTGNCTITMIFTSGVTATVNVNVVALNKTFVKMRQYDTETLTVYGTTASVQWTSSNPRVVTVTNGKLVGKGVGSAYVYAYVNGCKLGCTVIITSIDASR